ncbi:hypothetical protein AB0O75_10000 [Streptomyces sp. NPDC088921]
MGWAIGGTWVYGVTALLWPLAPLSQERAGTTSTTAERVAAGRA